MTTPFAATGTPFLTNLLIIAGIVVGTLLSLRVIVNGARRSRLFSKRVLILGATPLASKLIQEIQARPRCRYAIAGVVADGNGSGQPVRPLPSLGSLERLDKIIEAVRPDGIIVALAERRRRLPLRQLLARVHGLVVEDGAEVYEHLTGKLAIESLRPSSLIFSKDFRPSRLHLAIARGLSLLAAVVGLAVLAPLIGLIALIIKLDSHGPVFFIQDRVGLGGKPFRLMKFRTMRPANGSTSEWVRDNQDRITRVGKWLRKFRLDELPQLVNVLRGDMNLVGPRPHPASNFEVLVLVNRNLSDISGQEIPYYSLRSVVRPGITGWAQIRYGYANDLGEEIEKMRYDLYYIKHMSLWLDLRILCETVKVILLGSGAEAAQSNGAGAPAEGAGQWSPVGTGFLTQSAQRSPSPLGQTTGLRDHKTRESPG
jgi:exopolysaccharide biosynthesis polyprenyl glycosylphosphotransferase